jgi:hypothetical protein
VADSRCAGSIGVDDRDGSGVYDPLGPNGPDYGARTHDSVGKRSSLGPHHGTSTYDPVGSSISGSHYGAGTDDSMG